MSSEPCIRPRTAPCSQPETKPEPWRVHRARPTPGSGRAHKLSPKIPLPEHWQSRRRSQSPPPSDPVRIRVHPCPSVASLQLVLRRKRNSHEEGAEFWPRMDTDAHGFQVSSQFLDTTLVALRSRLPPPWGRQSCRSFPQHCSLSLYSSLRCLSVFASQR